MIRPILLQDLEFDEAKLLFYSSKGSPYFRMVRYGMPRIPQSVINCVFYLYASKKDAEQGINPGGTGFIVSFRGAFNGDHFADHYYAVTNWHVAMAKGYSVIRLNTNDGGIDVLEYSPDEWETIPGDADVAVLPLELDSLRHKVNSVSVWLFAPKGSNADIGVGDDVFMLGLFVDHAGVTTNNPKARFGNISMMPSLDAPVLQPTGYAGESYIVDIHSKPGFSGSPVFVYRTPLSGISGDWTREHFSPETNFSARINKTQFDRQIKPKSPFDRTPQIPKELDVQLSVNGSMFMFLGIHWGQFAEQWELNNLSLLGEARRNNLITDGAYVKGNSGMTCVIPSWKVYEVLNMPKLKRQRDERDESHKVKASSQVIAESVPQTTVSDATDENPNHREDFENLLDDAVKGTTKGG